MKKYFCFIFLAVMMIAFTCCSSDDGDEGYAMENGRYVYALQYDGEAPGYGDGSSRAVSKTWVKGAVIYLRIGSGSSAVLGEATYDGKAWTLKTDARLSGSGTCEGVYIENASSATSTEVTMEGLSAIYTGTGTYSVSGSTTNMSASLAPKYGRIRLKGTSGTSVSLSGLKTCTAYNISTGAFTTTTNAVTTSIQSTGYTPYLYGEITNSTLSTNGYTLTCPSTMMKAGESGWVNYPTASSHTGWVEGSGSSEVHEAVDLGLSVKWATCNVGASKPEEYGLYFAWGETVGYGSDTSDGRSFDWSSYKWCNGSYNTLTKYCTSSSYGNVDNKTVLDKEDDAASVNWGGDWRMPTQAERDELCERCIWTWTILNGVNGYEVKSKTNGNFIFLPAAGYRYDKSFNDAWANGCYWSSSLYTKSDLAYSVYFNSSGIDYTNYFRYGGRSVRPVCP